MKKYANKFFWFRLLAFIPLMLAVMLLLTAFKYEEDNDKKVSRFDLALMVESILLENGIDGDVGMLPDFIDISPDQKNEIRHTLAFDLMAGFPDRTFRPGQSVANIEISGCLQKLAMLLSHTNPDLQIYKKLLRLFGYQLQAEYLMSAKNSRLFPPSLFFPSEKLDRKVFKEIMADITGKKNKEKKVLCGRVIDAVTKKGLEHAYVAGAGRAVITGKSGVFSLDCPSSDQESFLVMATAEGYQPIELKKSLSLNADIVFRLRPIKSSSNQ